MTRDEAREAAALSDAYEEVEDVLRRLPTEIAAGGVAYAVGLLAVEGEEGGTIIGGNHAVPWKLIQTAFALMSDGLRARLNELGVNVL